MLNRETGTILSSYWWYRPTMHIIGYMSAVNRKLAAILATDAVGFSGQMDGLWPSARSHLLLGLACEQEVNPAHAKGLARDLLEEFPNLSSSNCKKPPFLDESCLERFTEAIKMAGLPA